MVREHNDYNIKKKRTSFKIYWCIMVILLVEMRLRMIENINKLTEKNIVFNAFVFILSVIHVIMARAQKNYNINP
jgi:hypothetical protein